MNMHRIGETIRTLMDTNIKRDKIIKREYTQNLFHHLQDRESNFNRQNFRGNINSRILEYETLFYKSITPCLSINNVTVPAGYIHKFSPNGEILILFSLNLKSVVLYNFKGVHNAQLILNNYHKECITSIEKNLQSKWIRQELFNKLFPKRNEVSITNNSYFRLIPKFCIFFEIAQYALMAGYIPAYPQAPSYSYPLRYADLIEKYDLCTYAFIILHVKKLKITYKKFFRYDVFMLDSNHGVTVNERKIGILSYYRQCIDFFEFNNGKLLPLFQIGAICVHTKKGCGHFELPPNLSVSDKLNTSLPLTELKQKVLSHIYRKILQIENDKVRELKLKKFYKNFDRYEKMLISKIQLIGQNHLLIRYEELQNHIFQYKCFIFYSLEERKILKIFKYNSIEFLKILRNYSHIFTSRNLVHKTIPSSPSNNIHVRKVLDLAIQKNPNEVAKRCNALLPISLDGSSTSRYFDMNLFDYEYRSNVTSEPQSSKNYRGLHFVDRETRVTKFRLQFDRIGEQITHEVANLIFHPFEPFVISIQRFKTYQICNFHIYNNKTIIDK